MFFIAYTFKGQVHVFAGRVKVVSHSSSGQVQYLNILSPKIQLNIQALVLLTWLNFFKKKW